MSLIPHSWDPPHTIITIQDTGAVWCRFSLTIFQSIKMKNNKTCLPRFFVSHKKNELSSFLTLSEQKKSKNVIIVWVQSLPVIDGPQWAEIKKWIVALVYWFRSAPMLGKMKLVFGFNTFFHCINLYWSNFLSSYCFYYSLSCYKFFLKYGYFVLRILFLNQLFY